MHPQEKRDPIAADLKASKRFVYIKPVSPTEHIKLDFSLNIDTTIELSAYYEMLIQAAVDVKKTMAEVNRK